MGDRANREQEGDDGPNDPIFQARTFDVPDPHGDLPSGSNRTPPRTCGNPIQLGIRQPEERFCFTARSSRQPHHPQHHVAPCDIDRARPIDHRAARVAARPRGGQQADDLVGVALQQRRPAQQAMLAVPRRDGLRRCPAPGKGSHRPHPSARPRARHGLAELPTSPLVARLSGREQRKVRKVVALRIKAMSYRP